MARYVVIAKFRAFRDFSLGEVLDTATDPRVAQLVLDGAPLAEETPAASEAARQANYFNMEAIMPGAVIAPQSLIEIGGEWPPVEWGTPARSAPKLYLAIDNAITQNLVEMRGSSTGSYALLISDSCGIVSNGQITSNGRFSLHAGETDPILVRLLPYNFGGGTDWVQDVEKKSAVYVAEVNNYTTNGGVHFFKGYQKDDVYHRAAWGADGVIGLSGGATVESDIEIARNAADQVTVRIGTAHADALRIAEAGDGETALLIRRNVTGAFTLQRVSMGIDNSGGAGFKLLRVPN